MASPHYTGIDETNGRIPVVDTVTDLQAQAGGYPGREVFVNSLRRSFILDPFSADTTDGATIIACTSGGQWRIQGQTTDDILRLGQGILAETASRVVCLPGNIAMVSGTVYYALIAIRAGTIVTNITISISTAAAATTVSKVALFTTAGVQLAVSADQGTNWQSTGNKTIAMVAPYTVLTTGVYYVAAMSVFTSTAPGIIRNATQSGNTIVVNGAIGSGAIPFGVQLAQADMPSPATIVVGSATAFCIWAAIT